MVVEGIASIERVESFIEELEAISGRTGCTVQAFDARYLVGRSHLERALTLADRAFERGENVARDRGVEVLLYAAGRRQIDQALELGVAAGELPVAVLIDHPSADNSREMDAADHVRAMLTPSDTLAYEHAEEDRLCQFYNINSAERGASAGDLKGLVLERVVLLEVEK